MAHCKFIGRVERHPQYDQYTVTINLDKAEAHVFAYGDRRYLKVHIGKLAPNPQGRTHCVYVEVRRKQDLGDAEGRVADAQEVEWRNRV